MRRKTRYVPHAKTRALLYACCLISLVVYALPKLPKLQPGIGGSFAVLWLSVAVLALAANVYFLVGADKERSRLLELWEVRRKEPRTKSRRGNQADEQAIRKRAL